MNLVSKRFGFQISLRTALILFVLLCLVLGLFLQWRHRSLLQRSVIRSLRDAYQDQVQIVYDFQVGDDQVRQRLFTGSPSWFGRRLGLDFVHRLAEVKFFAPAAREDLIRLADLTKVESIELNQGVRDASSWDALFQNQNLKSLVLLQIPPPVSVNPVDPEKLAIDDPKMPLMEGYHSQSNRFKGLENLTKLKDLHIEFVDIRESELKQILLHRSLQILRVSGYGARPELNELADVDAAQLKSLFFYRSRADAAQLAWMLSKTPNLEFLAVEQRRYDFKVNGDDEIFEVVAELKHLKQLFLHGLHIHGHSLHRLKELPLERLGLGLSLLDDTGLRAVTALENLNYLEIGSTHITDVGLESVAKMSRLEYLSIRDTLVTDKGLIELTALRNLKQLRVRDTLITDEGIQEFRRRLPDCFVDVQ